jgi:hypothetical protein
MNEKLPKAMLDALAREPKPAEHPAADVLAAFAEQALTEREQGSVTEHLARCAECREVVFLASAAAEEIGFQAGPTSAQAAAAIPRAKTATPKPRGWWGSRLLWAGGSLVAILVMVSGFFVLDHSRTKGYVPELAMKSAPVAPAPSEKTELERRDLAKTDLTMSETANVKALTTARPAPAKRKSNASQTIEVTASSSEFAPPQPIQERHAGATAAKPTAESAKVAIGGALAAPAPSSPMVSGFAPNAGQGQLQVDTLNRSLSRVIISPARAEHSGWRISPQGKLEHLAAEGWMRVLADEHSAFRVVAVVGGEVWAGGNDGMLFHSADNGVRWNKVSLDSAEHGAIVSIRFSDTQNGEAVTDSGSNYLTSDGGATWTKQ